MRALLGGAALLILASSAAPAQQPAPRDSTGRDSIVVDTTVPFRRRSPHTGRPCAYQGVDMPLQIVAAELAMAPSLLLTTPSLIMCRPDEKVGSQLGFARSHLAVYGIAAENALYDSSGAIWSGSAEALWRGGFAEYRVESIVFPHRYAYHTMRAGWLAHPWPSLMGGVTLGYRYVPALTRHEGVEIGFPFVAGKERAWARMETAYVMSQHMSSWNFRLQGEWALRRSPFVAGFNFEMLTLPLSRHSRVSAAPLGLLLGARL